MEVDGRCASFMVVKGVGEDKRVEFLLRVDLLWAFTGESQKVPATRRITAAECEVLGKGDLSESFKNRGQSSLDGLFLGDLETGLDFVEGDSPDEGHEVVVTGGDGGYS